jgi:hypothetical protein
MATMTNTNKSKATAATACEFISNRVIRDIRDQDATTLELTGKTLLELHGGCLRDYFNNEIALDCNRIKFETPLARRMFVTSIEQSIKLKDRALYNMVFRKTSERVKRMLHV